MHSCQEAGATDEVNLPPDRCTSDTRHLVQLQFRG